MKTPQRRFVVEFKSGRRQPKTKTNSIWGDTDLKAFAREVEEKASHLFNSSEPPLSPDSAEMGLADSLNAPSASEDGGDVDMARAVIPSSNGAETEILKHAADPPAAVEAVAQVQEGQPASQRRATTTGTPRKRAKRAAAKTMAHNSKVGHEDRQAQTGTVDSPISVDELATLDADNKRLKRLLAEQLRAQNLWLKKMLERFDAE
ncbi:hypothetical protein GOA59_31510 [Sinorhizobium meliloti]|uniref:Hypotherical protein n=2 Tax=Sinorhizobium TaxID=28105 RepID=E4MVE0_RHIML|nr:MULTISPECIES: hypothetical protein [Sinorhizobium]AGA08380.1 hypothetical protein C770_GR4pA068 [Sinorhizobium meliloti GR4]ASQ06042.1 hypothetical protein CDO23_18830 [Sinorhizobium meliloti]MDE3832119.1 hypothetical protein [Sinorhizobium meliloti]MDE4580244.1 hypothetical protein [Sinorhizobium meliloti]MDW9488334.1 hypothetical protein [Sinorhizobium meliloti]